MLNLWYLCPPCCHGIIFSTFFFFDFSQHLMTEYNRILRAAWWAYRLGLILPSHDEIYHSPRYCFFKLSTRIATAFLLWSMYMYYLLLIATSEHLRFVYLYAIQNQQSNLNSLVDAQPHQIESNVVRSEKSIVINKRHLHRSLKIKMEARHLECIFSTKYNFRHIFTQNMVLEPILL